MGPPIESTGDNIACPATGIRKPHDLDGANEVPTGEKAGIGSSIKQVPRFYQDDFHKVALKENTIIFLGTGLGKTFIPVLYMNTPQVAKEIEQGRKVVFLAPNRDLLKQQCEYIGQQVPYRVKTFCGGRLDQGNGASWQRELTNVDILFMMPDIFVFGISTNLLDWRQFVALIFDECHHAYNSKDKGLSSGDGSAYRSSLLHYHDYFADKPKSGPGSISYPRPRLIGLTASLINMMPKDNVSVAEMVSQLERLFQGRCITDLRVHESRPTVITYGYTSSKYTIENDLLTKILHNSKESISCALKKVPTNRKLDKNVLGKVHTRNASPQNDCQLGLSIKLENFPKIFDHLLFIREKCGLWALEHICERVVNVLSEQSTNHRSINQSAESKKIHTTFTDMIKAIRNSLVSFLKPLSPEESLLLYSSAKPLCLLNILEEEYENSRASSSEKGTFSCVVFVRNRIEVVAVHAWLNHISRTLTRYQFIECGHALGLAAAGAASKCTKRNALDQATMLQDLRDGKLNVVVTTAVLEEGIDLPNCSTVIRYDKCDNHREYVQSRGRARQQISTFFVMCEESDRSKVESELKNLNNLENELKLYISKRKFDPSNNESNRKGVPKAQANALLDDVDIYYARNKAVRIGPKVASQILNYFCQSSKDRSSGFKCTTVEPKPGVFQTTYTMPFNCRLKDPIKGKLKSSKDNANNSAAIAVLEALIKAKQLNDNGTSYSANDSSNENLQNVLTKQFASNPLTDQSNSQAQTIDQQRSSAYMIDEGTEFQSEPNSASRNLISLNFNRKSSVFDQRKRLESNKSNGFMCELRILQTQLAKLQIS